MKLGFDKGIAFIACSFSYSYSYLYTSLLYNEIRGETVRTSKFVRALARKSNKALCQKTCQCNTIENFLFVNCITLLSFFYSLMTAT